MPTCQHLARASTQDAIKIRGSVDAEEALSRFPLPLLSGASALAGYAEIAIKGSNPFNPAPGLNFQVSQPPGRGKSSSGQGLLHDPAKRSGQVIPRSALQAWRHPSAPIQGGHGS
ncbi:hypothetical protein D9M71_207190 [compost metagenome]